MLGLGLDVLGDLIHIRGWELSRGAAVAEAEGVAASSTVVSHVIRWLQRDSMQLKLYPRVGGGPASRRAVLTCCTLCASSRAARGTQEAADEEAHACLCAPIHRP